MDGRNTVHKESYEVEATGRDLQVVDPAVSVFVRVRPDLHDLDQRCVGLSGPISHIHPLRWLGCELTSRFGNCARSAEANGKRTVTFCSKR